MKLHLPVFLTLTRDSCLEKSCDWLRAHVRNLRGMKLKNGKMAIHQANGICRRYITARTVFHIWLSPRRPGTHPGLLCHACQLNGRDGQVPLLCEPPFDAARMDSPPLSCCSLFSCWTVGFSLWISHTKALVIVRNQGYRPMKEITYGIKYPRTSPKA